MGVILQPTWVPTTVPDIVLPFTHLYLELFTVQMVPCIDFVTAQSFCQCNRAWKDWPPVPVNIIEGKKKTGTDHSIFPIFRFRFRLHQILAQSDYQYLVLQPRPPTNLLLKTTVSRGESAEPLHSRFEVPQHFSSIFPSMEKI